MYVSGYLFRAFHNTSKYRTIPDRLSFQPLAIGEAHPDKASGMTQLDQDSSDDVAVLTVLESGRWADHVM